MRKCLALTFLVTFSWIGGLGQDARAGVTVDVLFQGAVVPTGITINAGDPGPGCVFGGHNGGSVSTGYCMDVVLRSTLPMISLSTSVSHSSGHGLAIGSMYEWKGPILGWSRGSPSAWCIPAGGLFDTGVAIESFDCMIPLPWNPPVVPAGTYRIGTIVWDTTGTTEETETITAFINDLFDGVSVVINGNVVAMTSQNVVVGTHLLTINAAPPTCGDGVIEAPEACDDGGTAPGDGCDASCQVELGWTCQGEPSVCTPLAVPSMSATGVTVLGVAVFGIGVMGLIIAARRRFN